MANVAFTARPTSGARILRARHVASCPAHITRRTAVAAPIIGLAAASLPCAPVSAMVSITLMQDTVVPGSCPSIRMQPSLACKSLYLSSTGVIYAYPVTVHACAVQKHACIHTRSIGCSCSYTPPPKQGRPTGQAAVEHRLSSQLMNVGISNDFHLTLSYSNS